MREFGVRDDRETVEQGRPEWLAEWQGIKAILALYLTIACGLILTGLLVKNKLAAEVLSTLFVAAPVCVIVRRQKDMLVPALKPKAGLVSWCAFSLLAGYLTFLAISWVVDFLNTSMNVEGINLSAPWHPYKFGLAGAIFFIAVCPAIFEEVAFRGFIQPRLEAYTGAAGAIIGASLIFSILHMNLVSFVHLSLMGIVLGIFRFKSGSLWPSICLHFSHNMFCTLDEWIIA